MIRKRAADTRRVVFETGVLSMTANSQIVRDFVNAWSTLDVDRIVDFFAEDGVYHNMPIAPVVGRSQLGAFIARFVKDWTAAEWEIVTLVESGDVVVCAINTTATFRARTGCVIGGANVNAD